MLFFIAFFQQSLSVHLMGYSFIFAAIFASGLTYLLLAISSRLDSPVMGLVFLFPVVAGICILMIRVSMLAVYV
jgi:xanthine/uracil permease